MAYHGISRLSFHLSSQSPAMNAVDPPPKTREPERVSCTENRKPTFMIREKASDGSLVLLKNLEALTSSTHPQIRDAFQLCN